MFDLLVATFGHFYENLSHNEGMCCLLLMLEVTAAVF